MQTMDTWQMTLQIFGMVFALWPVGLLSVLSGKRQVLASLLAFWVVIGLMRVALFFAPDAQMPGIIIAEPTNTILFFVAGGCLFVFYFLNRGVEKARFERRLLTAQGINDFLSLSPREFEDMVVALYNAAGHRARRTGASGDHGVDVVVQSKTGERWVVQCKRWRGTVGEPVIRDLYGAMQHEKAHKAVLFTTGKISQNAQRWAKGKPIDLHDGDSLYKIWRRWQQSKVKEEQIA